MQFRRGHFKYGVPLLYQGLHDGDVLQLLAVGRREGGGGRRCLFREVVQDVGREKRR